MDDYKFMEDADMLQDRNFESYEKTVHTVLRYKLATTKNLR